MTIALKNLVIRGAGALALSLTAVLPVLALAAGAPQAPSPPTQVDVEEAANAKLWNAKPAPSDPRDFQGVWRVRRSFRGFRVVTQALYKGNAEVDSATGPNGAARGFDPFIPETPLQTASRERRLAAYAAGTPLVQASADCLPHGTPRIMASGYPIQIDYGPEIIVILHEVTHDIRYIHMDGKPAPADEPLTFMGYSRGHWDGNTLIVDTDHLNARTSLDEEGLSHGEKMKVHEEFTKYATRYGGVEIRDQITIEDPDYYTRPWTSEKIFSWRSDLPITEYSCEENNRNQSENGVTVAR